MYSRYQREKKGFCATRPCMCNDLDLGKGFYAKFRARDGPVACGLGFWARSKPKIEIKLQIP